MTSGRCRSLFPATPTRATWREWRRWRRLRPRCSKRIWLAGGADLWLNTPVRGMEACGTSGMKASLNGALQFSTSDGWFDEIDRRTIGWVVPEAEAETAVYEMLETEV